MIKQKTVLVLGAGASQPYGFPLGAELVDEICAGILDAERQMTILGRGVRDQPSKNTEICNRLAEATKSFPPHQIHSFAKALRDARPDSVDTFLELRPEFRDIGKAAIKEWHDLTKYEQDDMFRSLPS